MLTSNPTTTTDTDRSSENTPASASARLSSIENALSTRVREVRHLLSERDDLRNRLDRPITTTTTAEQIQMQARLAQLDALLPRLLNQVQDLMLQRVMTQVEMGNATLRSGSSGANNNNNRGGGDDSDNSVGSYGYGTDSDEEHGLIPPRLRIGRLPQPTTTDTGTGEGISGLHHLGPDPLRELERRIRALRLPIDTHPSSTNHPHNRRNRSPLPSPPAAGLS
ncbi:hypothetical protein VTN77DRAFT_8850 [Rasamsonia byssochlamydoides]|uniref:uncharacterized protein n=1 Tax=Rasamsonia byssochlamydoides TaxID=89139 RepID=UPI003742EB87